MAQAAVTVTTSLTGGGSQTNNLATPTELSWVELGCDNMSVKIQLDICPLTPRMIFTVFSTDKIIFCEKNFFQSNFFSGSDFLFQEQSFGNKVYSRDQNYFMG